MRSDLDPQATKELLSELSSLARRYAEVFGPVGGRPRVWCFSNLREASETVRTLLGGRIERPQQAVHLPDPVAGGDDVIVVVPGSGDASILLGDLARAVAKFGVAATSAEVPPWLAAGIVEWFGWSTRPEAGAEGVRPSPSLRAALRDAWREGRRLGVDRLARLDGPSWRINDALQSGPLQRAEAGVLVAVLLGDPRTRGGVRRLLGARPLVGTTPLEAWRSVWPAVGPAQLDPRMDAVVERETTPLEWAIREARWIAEGRTRIADDAAMDTPARLRAAMLTEGVAIEEPCLEGRGGCPMVTPTPVIEWDAIEADRWTGRAGPWRVVVAWRPLGARSIGVVSFGRASDDDRTSPSSP